MSDASVITQLTSAAHGVKVAVKDMIDVEGCVTTAGCKGVARRAAPASTDADCVRLIKASGGRVIEKSNLHELAFGPTGINHWSGTPINPLNPALVPGGSSSGSAVAVASGRVDVAFGTDTGGSVRIPAACCGVLGLKTTRGRISLNGVRPLAPSLDTIGPLAKTVSGLVCGMRLLEPAFSLACAAPTVLGRLRSYGESHASPSTEAAIDVALELLGIRVVDVELTGWADAHRAARLLLAAEAFEVNGWLLDTDPDDLSEPSKVKLRAASRIDPQALRWAVDVRISWQTTVTRLLDRVDMLVLPTIIGMPPTIADVQRDVRLNEQLVALTALFNLAGVPALSTPIQPGRNSASDRTVPPSLQVIGRLNGEEILLALAVELERALAQHRGNARRHIRL